MSDLEQVKSICRDKGYFSIPAVMNRLKIIYNKALAYRRQLRDEGLLDDDFSWIEPRKK